MSLQFLICNQFAFLWLPEKCLEYVVEMGPPVAPTVAFRVLVIAERETSRNEEPSRLPAFCKNAAACQLRLKGPTINVQVNGLCLMILQQRENTTITTVSERSRLSGTAGETVRVLKGDID